MKLRIILESEGQNPAIFSYVVGASYIVGVPQSSCMIENWLGFIIKLEQNLKCACANYNNEKLHEATNM